MYLSRALAASPRNEAVAQALLQTAVETRRYNVALLALEALQRVDEEIACGSTSSTAEPRP